MRWCKSKKEQVPAREVKTAVWDFAHPRLCIQWRMADVGGLESTGCECVIVYVHLVKKERTQRTQGRDRRTAHRHHTGILTHLGVVCEGAELQILFLVSARQYRAQCRKKERILQQKAVARHD